MISQLQNSFKRCKCACLFGYPKAGFRGVWSPHQGFCPWTPLVALFQTALAMSSVSIKITTPRHW